MRRRLLSFALAAALGAGTSLPAASSWNHRPVQVIQRTQANFPPGLSGRGISQGVVRAVLNVNADGRLVDFLVTGYTHRELALELAALLPEWDYKPATIGRDPINARFEMKFTFTDQGSIVSVEQFDHPALQPRMLEEKLISALTLPPQLDRPLAPVHVVQPRHPGGTQGGGTAVLEFFVDPEGKPRLAAVASMTHEAFGQAAVAALAQWRFAPPTHRGQPTTVRVMQEFVFPRPPST